MTIKEIIDKLSEDSPERLDSNSPLNDSIKRLYPNLTNISKSELRDYQAQNFRSGGQMKEEMKIFFEGQNKVLVRCLTIETSELGKDVREVQNLEPLTLETEV